MEAKINTHQLFTHRILSWLATIAAALCLYFIDRFVFHLYLSQWGLGSFTDRFFIYLDIDRFDLLRLALAFASGFLLFKILDSKLRFLILTWLFWQTMIYLSYLVYFEEPLWFIQDYINGFFRFLTIFPMFLGGWLSTKIRPLHKMPSKNIFKLVVVCLGIIALALSVFPIIRHIQYEGYRNAHEFNFPMLENAQLTRQHWNPVLGRRIIRLKIKEVTTDSLLNFYNHCFRSWELLQKFEITDENISDEMRSKMKENRYQLYYTVAYGNNTEHIGVLISIFRFVDDAPDVHQVTLTVFPLDLEKLKEMERRYQEKREKIKESRDHGVGILDQSNL